MSILGRISELRKQHKKLSINKLEQECGLTRGSMAKWDDHAPSPDKVKKVADYFNVSVEYLLYGDPSAGIKKDPIPKDGAVSSAAQEIFDFLDSASGEELADVIKYIRYLKSQRG
uniref:Repressor protein n=1 Tax=Siphoviridae sp. ctSMg55 TaxID=2825509 RepID=A0A8S5V4R8_9CAUD|nr:MAG TPA: repressor protein [Siphoviridae sp. ctSMg55]